MYDSNLVENCDLSEAVYFAIATHLIDSRRQVCLSIEEKKREWYAE